MKHNRLCICYFENRSYRLHVIYKFKKYELFNDVLFSNETTLNLKRLVSNWSTFRGYISRSRLGHSSR